MNGCGLHVVFFFFKQKTAYEMRISDWSSDVCSSDLAAGAEAVTVIDGDTLVLADEREVRLVGIQTPKLPLGRAGFEAWPLAGEAKSKLEEIALGRVLDLGFGGRRERQGVGVGKRGSIRVDVGGARRIKTTKHNKK